MLQYPIVSDAGEWEKERGVRLQTVDDAHAEQIRQTQPFMRESDPTELDPLLLLQELSNTDKHKASVGVMLTSKQSSQEVTVDLEGAAPSSYEPNVEMSEPTLSDGFVLARVTSRWRIIKVRGNLGIEPVAYLRDVTGVPGNVELIPCLEWMADHFERLISAVWNYMPLSSE